MTIIAALTSEAHVGLMSEPEARDSMVARELALRAEQLVRTHYSFVWRAALGMGIPAADAEDVAQRVMINAARRIAARGRHRGAFRGGSVC